MITDEALLRARSFYVNVVRRKDPWWMRLLRRIVESYLKSMENIGVAVSDEFG